MSENFKQTSFLFGGNAVFIEELYNLYLENPNSVDKTWQEYFAKLKNNADTKNSKSTAEIISKETPKTSFEPVNISRFNIEALIQSYRKYAHYVATLDPLKLEVVPTKNDLKLNIENFGFNASQLNDSVETELTSGSLAELVNILDHIYLKNIGVEFDQVRNEEERNFLYNEFEKVNFVLSLEEKKTILNDLVEVEGFEQYLHTKFPGAKRFSVEGGESSIVAMDKAINLLMNYGVEEVILGMAHRGRLNTATKILGKPYKAILAGFITGNSMPTDLNISGDVKYHLGYSSDRINGDKKIHLSLMDNPSHLEAVNPLVAGKTRAKQDAISDIKREKIKAILVHGDSAFCGQGVVAECLSMSGLKAYDTGGILHLVINNQVGFTANAEDTRSSRYSTEFAKIIAAPILHVNGDDIEAVLKATNIAINYLQKFGKDVVIEIICYRKYGHNEGDEPMYTQSVMYNVIKNKPSPANVYANKLVTNKVIEENYFTSLKEKFKEKLDKEFEEAKNYKQVTQFLEGKWQGFTRESNKSIITGVNKKTLQDIGKKLCEVPSGFALNSKLVKLFEARKISLSEDKPIDWATAEQLAFASLLMSGTNIRLTGQDSGRGTFSHRHSVLHSQVNNEKYIPLNNLSDKQAKYEVADSNLSEYAVLGFEYGYSLADPRNLVIWEAQFGDFANGAQIIFDQFISSSETKWLRMSGIVALLPHGFEGQGPEHSSARLERFLQLAAENNIQVVYPTTPASFFHLLRRQILDTTRKALIVMSPKSLLRHKLAVSLLKEIDEGTKFTPIIDDTSEIKPENITRVVLCSGKIYYDLLEMRLNKNITNIAIIRLEQLYPFEKNLVIEIFKKYNKAIEYVWCQEEPKNMGSWNYINSLLDSILAEAGINKRFEYIGRDESASPAVGSLKEHNAQQEKLIKDTLKI